MHVAIFGAGVAGLTAAHELIKLGHVVTVYEANRDAGGFFRSARCPEDNGMPSEYSWHGFGPWYHNTFDVMKDIQFGDDTDETVYDRCLSRPVNFGIVGNERPADVADIFSKQKLPLLLSVLLDKSFRMSLLDKLIWGYILLKTWTANRRSHEVYALKLAADSFPGLSERAQRTWRSVFGPWVGSDWKNASLHHVGRFFRKNILSGNHHQHKADDWGEAWFHGPRDGWLLLRGPSSEVWFDRWATYLKTKGVTFHFGKVLEQLITDPDGRISLAVTNENTVKADAYVLAVSPFAAAEILARTPHLEAKDELRLLRPLTAGVPHTQVGFRIGFDERVHWPVKRPGVVLADSEWNLTLCAQEEVWAPGESLGKGDNGENILSLWTGTACVSSENGRSVPSVDTCTKEEFLYECLQQIKRCRGLDFLIRKANGVRFRSLNVVKMEAWHEWTFSPDGIKARQPKWVNTTITQPFMPSQRTPVPNLVLAGAHTKTTADVWSVEAAVESGRLAARHLDPEVKVISQYEQPLLRVLSFVDDVLFRLMLPHLLDCVILIGLVVTVVLLAMIR